jgi:uroporphyrinogen decarboxylase
MPSSNAINQKRLLATLAGETVDRPPFWLMRQAGRHLPEYRTLRDKTRNFLEFCYTPDLAVEATLQPVRRYHPDAAILFADILLIPDALGQALDYLAGEGPVLEPIRKADELTRLSRQGIHEHLSPVYETVARLAAELPDDVALIGFAGAPWTVATYMVEGGGSRDHAHTKRWAFGDPAGFDRLIDLLVEVTIEYLDRQVRAGADVVQLFDTWAGALPEAAFRRWCIDPVRRIAEALKNRHPGLPIIGFPRGAGQSLVTFARHAGVDAVSLDSTVPLAWAADVLQPLVVVQGNLDPQMLVVGGSAMAAAIDDIVAQLGGGRFVFNLGHGIVPDTPPEHVAALAARIKQMA